MKRRIVEKWGVRTAAVMVVVSLVVICAIGGGVYAALGGFARSSATTVDLQKGLMAWYQMEGNAKDSTPYANDGTVTDAAPTTDRKGRANSAYSLNGTSTFIRTTPTPWLATKYSASLWVKAAVTTQGQFSGILNNWNSLSGGSNDSFQIDTSNGSPGSYRINMNTQSMLFGPVTTSWQLLTVTYDGTTMRTYVNGVAANSQDIVPSQAGLNFRNYIIGRNRAANNYFNGSVDDVRIYNRALNANEVDALYKQYNPNIKVGSGEKGLVLHYKLDGNAKDATPLALNGTLGTAVATTDRKGKANGAYSFDGTGDYIGGSGSSVLNANVNQARTYSAWVKSSSIATSYRNFLWKEGGCVGWSLYIIGGGNMAFSYKTGTSCSDTTSYFAITSGTDYGDNKWHLVTGVVDRGSQTMQLYIDGTLKVTQAIDNTAGGTGGTFRVGTDWNDSHPFIGSIDDVRVYARGLSAAEVKNLYDSYNSQINLNADPTANGGTAVNLNSGLVGYWPMNGNARDATPYGDNAVVSGATLTTDRRNRSNSAYNFNGTSDYMAITSSMLKNVHNSGQESYSLWYTYGNGTLLSRGSATSPVSCSYEPRINVNNISLSGCSNSGVFSTFTPSVGWNHLVLTMDKVADQVKVYVNGSVVTSTSLTAITAASSRPELLLATTNDVLYLGTGMQTESSLTGYHTGKLDDVRIYNRALTPAEVNALYNLYR